uniref:Uncharacterized protein n=1 Tax=Rhizophora mucronata TaxID=61149 RepID=A0A2P2QVL7_RHIMU
MVGVDYSHQMCGGCQLHEVELLCHCYSSILANWLTKL